MARGSKGCRRHKKKWNCGGRKRKYLCARKRKATTRRCCPKRTNKVTICNRNWRRISVRPFVNFLRDFRKGKYTWPLSKLVAAARKRWCRMSREEKRCYVIMACRARKRGYRT